MAGVLGNFGDGDKGKIKGADKGKGKYDKGDTKGKGQGKGDGKFTCGNLLKCFTVRFFINWALLY